MPRRKKYENLQGGSRNKRGVYTRPEDSEKTIKSRDGETDYEGVKFSDYKKVKAEKKRKADKQKAKSSRFGNLISRIVGRD